jgi:hypothetical protein
MRLMAEAAKRRLLYFRVLGAAIVLPVSWFAYLYIVRPLVLVTGVFAYPAVTQEMGHLESPDREVAAVVMQSNPGATEPYYYTVYLIRLGSRDLGKPVLDASGSDPKLRWIAPRLLEISYSDMCIGAFQNHWNSMELQNGLYDVEIRLKPPNDATPRRCN